MIWLIWLSRAISIKNGWWRSQLICLASINSTFIRISSESQEQIRQIARDKSASLQRFRMSTTRAG